MTTSLLLAAIRDLGDAALSTKLDEILGGREGPPVILPTYCDRTSYARALLDDSDQDVQGRPYAAKRYFLKRLSSSKDLSRMAEAVLHGLTWLFFPLDLSGHDGTENLNVIYERLAIRDATFCVPTRGTAEHVGMGSADFVRNLVLGSFPDDVAVHHYEAIWLPDIEGRAADAVLRQERSVADVLEALFTAFLETASEEPSSSWSSWMKPSASKKTKKQKKISGQDPLYPRFRAWWQENMDRRPGNDKAASDLLKRLAAFSRDYFSQTPETSTTTVAEHSISVPEEPASALQEV